MVALAVLVRELQAESRRRGNYGSRVLAAAIAVVVVLLFWSQSGQWRIGQGKYLFSLLNGTVFLCLWIVAPILTADCISREKREGTLGLLFLTNLSSAGIALGKSTAQMVRASVFFLAVLPVLTLPLLLGGVARADLLLALLLDSSALLLGLAAGLIASSYAAHWTRAILLAESISFVFAVVFSLVHLFALQSIQMLYAPNPRFPLFYLSERMGLWQGVLSSAFWTWPVPLQIAFALEVDTGARLSDFQQAPEMWTLIHSSWPLVAQRAWLWLAGTLWLASVLTLGVAVLVAAAKIRHSWRIQPLSALQVHALQTFCKPLFWKSLFRSRMTRLLNRNPIGWLHQQSWRSRLIRWGWCCAALLLECMWLTDGNITSAWAGQFWLGYFLLLGLAFSSSNSFRLERETGAFELLLVTPLRERQIIWGRLRAIWSQFLPAALVYALAWGVLFKNADLYSTLNWSGSAPETGLLPTSLLPAYLTLPMVGLCCSILIRNTLTSWIVTAAVGLLLPFLAAGLGGPSPVLRLLDAVVRALSGFDLESRLSLTATRITVVAVQTALAALAWLVLQRRLRQRPSMVASLNKASGLSML